ncbi:hypothetical protein MMC08_008796 [Hypocenomyce scalaris]|nr:hypothetical protein [Hypocenomyce scalaris]
MDDWTNYSVFLSAKAVQVCCERERLAKPNGGSGGPDFFTSWKLLWGEVQGWYRERPVEMHSIIRHPIGEFESGLTNAFPQILFSTAVGMCGNQFYHMAALQLLQSKPRSIKLPAGSQSTIWHALQICGIALSNEQHGCWDLALLASVLRAGSLMSHEGQQREITLYLGRMQQSTGWKIQTALDDLQKTWAASNTV